MCMASCYIMVILWRVIPSLQLINVVTEGEVDTDTVVFLWLLALFSIWGERVNSRWDV